MAALSAGDTLQLIVPTSASEEMDRQMRWQRQLFVWPTWVYFHLAKRFLPKTHKWKHRNFTLRDWAYGSTRLNDTFSLIFWEIIVGTPILIHALFN
jgi:hypothetical protein